MKRYFLLLVLSVSTTTLVFAQREEEKDKPSFKENFFTGGSISLAFYSNTFLIGGNPVLGYSLTDWADAGIVINYNYTSYRDYNGLYSNKLHQSVYGGGGFVKLYPVRFLFAQAQLEHNYIRQKFLQSGSDYVQTAKADVSSFLIGGGYTSGREGRGGEPFYYLAVLFDVSHNINSPYTDGFGRTIPIIRAGLQVPLFQGGHRRR